MPNNVGQVVIGQRGRASNGAPKWATSTSDGAMSQVPWLMSLSLEGLLFSTMFGAADQEDTDPGTFGPGAIVFTELDMLVTLPATNTLQVIPIYWKPIFEALGTIAAVDILLISSAGAVMGANSITPTLQNIHDSSNNVSLCTISALGDAGGTAPTSAIKTIYREGTTALTGSTGNNAPVFQEYSAQRMGYVHVVSGASRQVAAFTGAQAGTGYYHYVQAELPAGSV